MDACLGSSEVLTSLLTDSFQLLLHSFLLSLSLCRLLLLKVSSFINLLCPFYLIRQAFDLSQQFLQICESLLELLFFVDCSRHGPQLRLHVSLEDVSDCVFVGS